MENENKYIPHTGHIWLEDQFSTPPRAQISEVSTAEEKNNLISSVTMQYNAVNTQGR